MAAYEIEGEQGYQGIGDTFNKTGDKYFGGSVSLLNPKVVAAEQLKVAAALGVSALIIFYAWKKL